MDASFADVLVDKGTYVLYDRLMLASDLVEAVRHVAATDPTMCDEGELRSLAASAHRVRCWLDAVDAAVVACSAELASVGGRRSSREADVIAERSAVCAAMPEVHEALAAGTLSAGHADAIARASNRLDAEERVELAAQAPSLVEQAATTSVDAFARKVRDLARRISRDEGLRHHEKLRSQRAVRRWMDREGMCHTQISLDPEADARLSAAFDAAIAAEKAKPDNGRTFDQLKADAFMAMVTSTPVPGARHHAEILMLIDLETAPHRASRVQHLRDLRRPAPPTSHGSAAGVRSRTSSRSCWTATAESSTSAEPNGSRPPINEERSAPCTEPAPHRTAPSASATATSTTSKNGTKAALTNLENLIPLCSKHHHLIHEGQWRPPARAPAA